MSRELITRDLDDDSTEYWIIEGVPGGYHLLRLEVVDAIGPYRHKYTARDHALGREART